MTELAHRGVLPGILAAVEEEDVVALDVKATEEFVGLVGASFDLGSEDPIAVVGPVVYIDGVRAGRLLIIGRLEEAELSAVLPSPLATGVRGINLRVAKGNSIVAVIGDATVFGQSSNCIHQAVLGSVSSL